MTCQQADAQRELLQQLLERDAERGRQLSEAATALEALAMQHRATQGTLEQLQSQMQQVNPGPLVLRQCFTNRTE